MQKKSSFHPVDPKTHLPKLEHDMLEFWEREKIFEKSVEARKGGKKFVFFDGPPFANGLPHYGHILANALKDAVTRYATMRGFYVPRTNGWDCHGLPVEYEIEKELKISGRKNIEKMGVARFNAECRKSVFRYTEEWEKLLRRIARWVDFDHSYATLENGYMESIWWVFKEIWKKDMVYQGHKSMHICWRCETPLSNFEVTLGYKEVVDLSITVKFKLLDEPNTYLLAWTTTPWTMPAHSFINVGPDIEYVKVKYNDDFYIVAKEAIEKNFRDKEYEIVQNLKAKDLEGRKYEPPLPYYKNLKNAFQVFIYPEVSASEGTGLVHMAPAFGGEEEVAFMRSKNIEPIVHVNMDGTFTKEVTDWAGKIAKAEVTAIKDKLESEGKLFSHENYKHSYPHCWRCDTPLLAYLTKAWFIRITDIKKKLLGNNKKIRWVPPHIQEGRFGKWLEGARDWNISRNRFWGCPIPVWECGCGAKQCIGSVKELREHAAQGNTLYFIRHGEAEQNEKGMLNSDPKHVFHLTAKGKRQAEKMAAALKKEGIDMIFASPFARTKETAEILSEATGKPVEFSQHLREHDMGIFEGKTEKEFLAEFPNLDVRWKKKVQGGESFSEVFERTSLFLDYLGRKYSGKKIAIVTHGNIIRSSWLALGEKTLPEIFQKVPEFAEAVVLMAGKLPLRDGKLDLHKPYIDEVTIRCEKCGGEMKRIPEVLDCWFESGSMPYAQLHYPFENKEEFEKNFPANFIAEGLDQTRGWFYTLHVLSTILFNEPAFKNVIVNGILLAADGEKLSKRKKNYPDPNMLFETHGVDSTRMFLYTSTAPLAEDVRFSEKHVEEIVKQFTLTLWNTYSFFVTYANIDQWKSDQTKRGAPRNNLDAWILSELNTLIEEVTQQMEEYSLTKATRPLLAFVDNLSNWYIRRSRRRFWKSENDGDKSEAYETLFTVLTTLTKLLAPFMPFAADAIYKNLTGKTSVHLEDWPQTEKKLIRPQLNSDIHVVRTIVSLALKIRAQKSIKVRQPLSRVIVALPKHVSAKLIEEYRDVILEELNVKDIQLESDGGSIAIPALTVDSRKIGPKFGAETQKIIALSKAGDFEILKNGSAQLGKGKQSFTLKADEFSLGYRGREGLDVASEEGILVGLETTVTPELLQEGYARDIIRHIQDLRKQAGYDISDRIVLFVQGPKKLQEAVTRFADFIQKETLGVELQEGGDFEWDKEEEVAVDGMTVKIGVRAQGL